MSELDATAGRLTGATTSSPASSPAGPGDEAAAGSTRISASLSNETAPGITSHGNYFLSETPASPPLTASGSQADLSHTTPRPNAFTPPDSAPMSADASQNPSYTPNQPQNPREIVSSVNDNSARIDLQRAASAAQCGIISVHGSATDIAPAHCPSIANQHSDQLNVSQTDPMQLDWSLSNDAPFYKTSGTSHRKTNTLFSQDLFRMFGIQQIASDVARYHTTTGEKNPLRKTYQNFIKDISGKNKPTAKPQELTDLLTFVDEDWAAGKVAGRSIEPSLSQDLLAKLESAVQLEPGKLARDENEKWKAVLDLDDAPSRPTTWSQSINNHIPPKLPVSANAISSPEPSRVSRRGTKRRYDEDSFEGYGEGYIDDAIDSPDAELDEDERRNSGKKKRRRDTGGTSTSVFSDKLGPLNNSRISVGNGSYPNR